MLSHCGEATFKFSIQMLDLFEKAVSNIVIHGFTLLGQLSFKSDDNLFLLNNALSKDLNFFG
jgi:hypothetical protein